MSDFPPFFISYAHAGSGSDNAAQRFYHELRGDLLTLVRRPVGASMGFFDAEGLQTGVHWREELADALGHCQVLVALLSVPYLGSEWCGKEWHAFTLRERELLPSATGFKNQGPIIPIRWAPIPSQLPLAAVGGVQFFKPQNIRDQQGAKALQDLAEWYEEDGIFGLLQQGREDAFRAIVWDLAKCIQKIYYNQLLKPREFNPEELRNVFEGGVQ